MCRNLVQQHRKLIHIIFYVASFTVFARSLPAVAHSNCSFSLLYNIPLHKYAKTYLPILLLVDGWIISGTRLLQIL